jgi:hypothetical protein
MWIQCKSDPRSQFINLPNPKSHQILGLLDLQKNKDGPRKWRLSLPCSNDYMIFWHSWCLLSVPSTSLGANELDKSSKQKILKLKKMSTCNISNIIWNTASQKPKLIYLYLHIYIYTLSLSLHCPLVELSLLHLALVWDSAANRQVSGRTASCCIPGPIGPDVHPIPTIKNRPLGKNHPNSKPGFLAGYLIGDIDLGKL